MRRHLLFVLFFLQVFLKKHFKPIAIAVMTGFFSTVFTILVSPYVYGFLQTRHDRIGIVGSFTENTLPLSIQNRISMGLTALTTSGEATPSVATSWEINNEGKEYVFHLNPNIVWHDGKRFTAHDIQYSLIGAEFTPVDDTTMKITLSDPYAPLPVLLAVPIFRNGFTGLGPYIVKQAEKEDGYLTVLKLHPKDTTKPLLTYKFYRNADDAKLAFKLGEVDHLEQMSSGDDFSDWEMVEVNDTVLYDRFVGLFFNLNNEHFKEKEVRHALAYAVPEINPEEKAVSPISPLSWAYSTKIRLYTPNPESAKKILSNSPLASDSATITLSTMPGLIDTAEKIAQSWKALGVQAKVRVENSMPSEYDIFLVSQSIPPDPDQYQFWQSTQESTNISKYNSQKIDKLLEDGRKTIDKEKRIKIYADFQRYLVDDLPVIFLYYPKAYSVVRK